jgi:hypothetical protein
METALRLYVVSLCLAGGAAADPLSDWQEHCIRPLAEQRCVLADADAAGLREVKPNLTPVAGTMAFRLKGRAQLLFSGLEPYRCHVFAPRMTAAPVLPAAPDQVRLRAQKGPGGRGWLLTAETDEALAAPMAR